MIYINNNESWYNMISPNTPAQTYDFQQNQSGFLIGTPKITQILGPLEAREAHSCHWVVQSLPPPPRRFGGGCVSNKKPIWRSYPQDMWKSCTCGWLLEDEAPPSGAWYFCWTGESDEIEIWRSLIKWYVACKLWQKRINHQSLQSHLSLKN